MAKGTVTKALKKAFPKIAKEELQDWGPIALAAGQAVATRGMSGKQLLAQQALSQAATADVALVGKLSKTRIKTPKEAVSRQFRVQKRVMKQIVSLVKDEARRRKAK